MTAQERWTEADAEVSEVKAIAVGLDLDVYGISPSEFARIITGDNDISLQLEFEEVRK